MKKLTQKYVYNATVERITDGDSIVLNIDHGFKIYSKQIIRLARINAPEVKTPEGLIAKAYLINLLPVGSIVTIQTSKTDMYGRYVGEGVFDGANLSDQIVTDGQAVYVKY